MLFSGRRAEVVCEQGLLGTSQPGQDSRGRAQMHFSCALLPPAPPVSHPPTCFNPPPLPRRACVQVVLPPILPHDEAGDGVLHDPSIMPCPLPLALAPFTAGGCQLVAPRPNYPLEVRSGCWF